MSQTRFLMCPPDHYRVDYIINPWMKGNIHNISSHLARSQWQRVFQTLNQYTSVDVITPQPSLPDMVFTANAGLVLGNTVILSRFFNQERQGEALYFKQWFLNQGYTVYELPDNIIYEGAGDTIYDCDHRLWAGYGFRSQLSSHTYLSHWLDIEVLSLRLIDERFYHLDTCFCLLEGGYLLYYPSAFDCYSNRLIEMLVPESKLIPVTEIDAVNFACNAININQTIVLNKASSNLKNRLCAVGFDVIESPLTEFTKAGGSARCLTLQLTEIVHSDVGSSSVKLSPLANLLTASLHDY